MKPTNRRKLWNNILFLIENFSALLNFDNRASSSYFNYSTQNIAMNGSIGSSNETCADSRGGVTLLPRSTTNYCSVQDAMQQHEQLIQNHQNFAGIIFKYNTFM